MDGTVAASLEQDPDLFYKDRVTFLSALTDEEISKERYVKEVGGLFEKIQSSIDHTDIVLWFEHDVFCQVNCWFIIWLIARNTSQDYIVWMVHPKEEAPFSFAAHTMQELVQAFEHAQPVKDLDRLAKLRPAYCNQDNQGLITLAHKLKSTYPFLMPAIQAHLDRHPTGESPGRPTQTLMQIKQSTTEASFGEIFQEFSRREGVYGMGDLQVKQLLQSEL
jgi:HPt (histidine-containing phosphotransfer) domain-containing protein